MVVLFTSHKYRIKDMTPQLKNNIIEWWQLNPEFTFKYFDDYSIDKWIYSHLSKKEQIAFRHINTGAGKADFFRISYIYHCGGIWVDCDLPAFCIFSKYNILNALQQVDTIIVKNRKCNNPRYTFIAGNSKSIVIKRLLQQIVDNIYSEISLPMKKNTLDITGPFVLHRILCDMLHLYSIDRLQHNKLYCLKNTQNPILLYLDDRFFAHIYAIF